MKSLTLMIGAVGMLIAHASERQVPELFVLGMFNYGLALIYFFWEKPR